MNDTIDIAPIDPEVERGGADKRAQLAIGHRALDLAPRVDRQRTVVDANCIFGFVGIPQFLEDKLRQKPRVAENQRDFVPANFLDQLWNRMLPAMPRPRHPALGEQYRQVRLSRRLALDQPDKIDVAVRGQPCTVIIGIGNRRRQRHALHIGCQRLEPGERKAQQIAALAIGECMDLINDDSLERRKHQDTVLMAEE